MSTDGIRMALGTLTRIPVAAPRVVDGRTARAAMLLAPVVGLIIALPIGVGAQILSSTTAAPGLLSAALAIAALAWITRGLHLDGLADTADAFGSGRPAAEALAIARKSDIGPFGVIALVLALMIQIVALGYLLDTGAGGGAFVIAIVIGRMAMTLACTPMFPAARADGLGATVSGSVPTWVAWAMALGWTALFAGSVGRAHGPTAAVATGVAVIAALAVALAWAVVARRRLGGITGDVLGSLNEIAMTVVLVAIVIT